MPILKNQNIRAYNSFHFNVEADLFIVDDIAELLDFLSVNKQAFYILGGGSNILFGSNFDRLLIKNELNGIEIIEENNDEVLISVASGENWHQFVLWALDHNYYGIENLSLIPGTVGAAPIQNIGAYGVELSDVLRSVEFIDLDTFKIKNLNLSACNLGYRDSIFKNELKGKCFITKVVLNLQKQPDLKIAYGAIANKLKESKIINPTGKDISNIIIEIRNQKLPDPDHIGNAGSFFKNVVVSVDILKELKYFYPDIPHYPVDEELIKIPTAWLIDQCGWKGKRFKDAGVHPEHALVLVNYGACKGEEILTLADNIRNSVWEKFGIEITPEVNIVD